ncbi:hypothetical protein LT493_35415 [Streptomyces tricolor]|nr:hypothetical protein [Streptomyces tricolor]
MISTTPWAGSPTFVLGSSMADAEGSSESLPRKISPFVSPSSSVVSDSSGVVVSADVVSTGSGDVSSSDPPSPHPRRRHQRGQHRRCGEPTGPR